MTYRVALIDACVILEPEVSAQSCHVIYLWSSSSMPVVKKSSEQIMYLLVFSNILMIVQGKYMAVISIVCELLSNP